MHILLALVMALTGPSTQVRETQVSWLEGIQPCIAEDSHNCYWDASTRGNKRGHSYTDLNGEVWYWADTPEDGQGTPHIDS